MRLIKQVFELFNSLHITPLAPSEVVHETFADAVYPAEQISSVKIFEERPGVWKFRSGVQTWGSYPSYADAERVAKRYNFLNVEK